MSTARLVTMACRQKCEGEGGHSNTRLSMAITETSLQVITAIKQTFHTHLRLNSAGDNTYVNTDACLSYDHRNRLISSCNQPLRELSGFVCCPYHEVRDLRSS